MDGDPILVFKPVFKSFKFKTSEAKVQRNTSLKDSNEFIDEKWKPDMDCDLPELVAFHQDCDYPFVKDIGVDRVVPLRNICLEENRDFDLDNVACVAISDAGSTSGSTVESQCSSESSNSTVSNHISDHLWEEDASEQSCYGNLTVEDGETFVGKDDTSSYHSTKKTISETLLHIRQDSTKAVSSDSEILSIHDNRRSKYSLKAALHKARRVELSPRSVECHSRISSKNGRDISPVRDSSKDGMLGSLTGLHQSRQYYYGTNAKREVWHASVECRPQVSSEDCMSDSVTDTSQSQQHLHGNSSSSVSGPLAIYSRAVPSFGSISFGSNSSTTSSESFAFPLLSAEWAGSPVRMAEADRKQIRRHRRWALYMPAQQAISREIG